MGWGRGGSPRLRHPLPLPLPPPRSWLPCNRPALEVHNGFWKLNLWAGNRSREIEGQQNRACGPVTDVPSPLLTMGVAVGEGWVCLGGGCAPGPSTQ